MNELREDVIDWVIRTNTQDFDSWEELSDWLGASPERARAYNELVALDGALPRHMVVAMQPSLGRSSADFQRIYARPRVVVSATLIALVIMGVWQRPDVRQVVGQGPSGTRLELGEGVSVQVTRQARVSFQRFSPRSVLVEHGQVSFHVDHRPGRQFQVQVGGLQVNHIGTVFEVKRTATTGEVAVSEGLVMVTYAGKQTVLKAGQRLRQNGNDLPYVMGQALTPKRDIGPQRLTYAGAPCRQLAHDLSFRLSAQVVCAPVIAERPLNGSLLIGSQGVETIPSAARLFGMKARQLPGGGWLIEAARE